MGSRYAVKRTVRRKVDLIAFVAAEPNTGCWLWTGPYFPNGYGCCAKVYGSRLAHRASYLLHVGTIPPGAFVCHRCDVKGCVNPEHLFLATHDENMADMRAKGRSLVGARNAASKLLYVDVQEIRALAGALSQERIGRLYGVAQSHVADIIHNRNWRV